jgi:hypothetical protein
MSNKRNMMTARYGCYGGYAVSRRAQNTGSGHSVFVLHEANRQQPIRKPN